MHDTRGAAAVTVERVTYGGGGDERAPPPLVVPLSQSSTLQRNQLAARVVGGAGGTEEGRFHSVVAYTPALRAALTVDGGVPYAPLTVAPTSMAISSDGARTALRVRDGGGWAGRAGATVGGARDGGSSDGDDDVASEVSRIRPPPHMHRHRARRPVVRRHRESYTPQPLDLTLPPASQLFDPTRDARVVRTAAVAAVATTTAPVAAGAADAAHALWLALPPPGPARWDVLPLRLPPGVEVQLPPVLPPTPPLHIMVRAMRAEGVPTTSRPLARTAVEVELDGSRLLTTGGRSATAPHPVWYHPLLGCDASDALDAASATTPPLIPHTTIAAGVGAAGPAAKLDGAACACHGVAVTDYCATAPVTIRLVRTTVAPLTGSCLARTVLAEATVPLARLLPPPSAATGVAAADAEDNALADRLSDYCDAFHGRATNMLQQLAAPLQAAEAAARAATATVARFRPAPLRAGGRGGAPGVTTPGADTGAGTGAAGTTPDAAAAAAAAAAPPPIMAVTRLAAEFGAASVGADTGAGWWAAAVAREARGVVGEVTCAPPPWRGGSVWNPRSPLPLVDAVLPRRGGTLLTGNPADVAAALVRESGARGVWVPLRLVGGGGGGGGTPPPRVLLQVRGVAGFGSAPSAAAVTRVLVAAAANGEHRLLSSLLSTVGAAGGKRVAWRAGPRRVDGLTPSDMAAAGATNDHTRAMLALSTTVPAPRLTVSAPLLAAAVDGVDSVRRSGRDVTAAEVMTAATSSPDVLVASRTSLHLAALGGNLHTLRHLLAMPAGRACVAVEDGSGYTPFETAVAVGNMAAATLLCGVSRVDRGVAAAGGMRAAAAALDALTRTYPGLGRATRGVGNELAAAVGRAVASARAGAPAGAPAITAAGVWHARIAPDRQWQFGSPALAGSVALPPVLTALAALSPASLLLWLQLGAPPSARVDARDTLHLRRPFAAAAAAAAYVIHVVEGDAMLHVLARAASAVTALPAPPSTATLAYLTVLAATCGAPGVAVPNADGDTALHLLARGCTAGTATGTTPLAVVLHVLAAVVHPRDWHAAAAHRNAGGATPAGLLPPGAPAHITAALGVVAAPVAAPLASRTTTRGDVAPDVEVDVDDEAADADVTLPGVRREDGLPAFERGALAAFVAAAVALAPPPTTTTSPSAAAAEAASAAVPVGITPTSTVDGELVFPTSDILPAALDDLDAPATVLDLQPPRAELRESIGAVFQCATCKQPISLTNMRCPACNSPLMDAARLRQWATQFPFASLHPRFATMGATLPPPRDLQISRDELLALPPRNVGELPPVVFRAASRAPAVALAAVAPVPPPDRAHIRSSTPPLAVVRRHGGDVEFTDVAAPPGIPAGGGGTGTAGTGAAPDYPTDDEVDDGNCEYCSAPLGRGASMCPACGVLQGVVGASSSPSSASGAAAPPRPSPPPAPTVPAPYTFWPAAHLLATLAAKVGAAEASGGVVSLDEAEVHVLRKLRGAAVAAQVNDILGRPAVAPERGALALVRAAGSVADAVAALLDEVEAAAGGGAAVATAVDAGGMDTCAVCMEDYPAAAFLTLAPCGHSFCISCWRGHLSNALATGGRGVATACRCLDQPTCRVVVDERVWGLAAESGAGWLRYNTWLAAAFADAHRAMLRRCANPKGCNQVLYLPPPTKPAALAPPRGGAGASESKDSKLYSVLETAGATADASAADTCAAAAAVVLGGLSAWQRGGSGVGMSALQLRCVCGFATCALCGAPDHLPAACHDMTAFRAATNLAVAAATHSFLSNYLPCPHCGAITTRVSGCRHMSCPCGGSFCFSCGQPWAGYGHVCPLFGRTRAWLAHKRREAAAAVVEATAAAAARRAAAASAGGDDGDGGSDGSGDGSGRTGGWLLARRPGVMPLAACQVRVGVADAAMERVLARILQLAPARSLPAVESLLHGNPRTPVADLLAAGLSPATLRLLSAASTRPGTSPSIASTDRCWATQWRQSHMAGAQYGPAALQYHQVVMAAHAVRLVSPATWERLLARESLALVAATTVPDAVVADVGAAGSGNAAPRGEEELVRRAPAVTAAALATRVLTPSEAAAAEEVQGMLCTVAQHLQERLQADCVALRSFVEDAVAGRLPPPPPPPPTTTPSQAGSPRASPADAPVRGGASPVFGLRHVVPTALVGMPKLLAEELDKPPAEVGDERAFPPWMLGDPVCITTLGLAGRLMPWMRPLGADMVTPAWQPYLYGIALAHGSCSAALIRGHRPQAGVRWRASRRRLRR